MRVSMKEDFYKNRAGAAIISSVTDILPARLIAEIVSLGTWRADFPSGLSELRIRVGGVSFAIVSGECLPLRIELTRREIEDIYTSVISGSVYAYKEETLEGFVTMQGGVRVGICGDARYDGGRICSVKDISSLIFRIPVSESENAEDIYELWRRCEGGLLLFSPPGAGKTSALRKLAYYIGTGSSSKRTVVVDERREFIPEDYAYACVDILKGYKKDKGIEIAVRTLGAEVIILDEIGTDAEADAIFAAGMGGVTVIAACHGGSLAEVMSKDGIARLVTGGFFDTAVRLYKEGAAFMKEVTSLKNLARGAVLSPSECVL